MFRAYAVTFPIDVMNRIRTFDTAWHESAGIVPEGERVEMRQALTRAIEEDGVFVINWQITAIGIRCVMSNSFIHSCLRVDSLVRNAHNRLTDLIRLERHFAADADCDSGTDGLEALSMMPARGCKYGRKLVSW